MFEMIANLYDAVRPQWKTMLFAVSSDGDQIMTERIAGVVTRLGNALY